MTDFTAILEEFEALTAEPTEYKAGRNQEMSSPAIDQTFVTSGEMTSLFESRTSYRDRSPNRRSRDELMDALAGGSGQLEEQPWNLGTGGVEEQPWDIVQWLLTSQQEGRGGQEGGGGQENMFLPPLPRHKSRSERSFCSEKSSNFSEKSALSSVTLDSESEAASTRLRCKRRARRPARYQVYPDLDWESDSTLNGRTEQSGAKKALINKVPRYKRPSHINAEHRRRFKIKNGFEGLNELLPPSNVPGKDSQVAMLARANDYIRQLHEEKSNSNQELEELRLAVHNLNIEISSAQASLPVEGLDQTKSMDEDQSMDELLEKYVQNRTTDNWKFWIFSYLVRPLYQSYKRAVSCDASTFVDLAERVRQWVNRDLTLPLLRPGTLQALCTFGVTSSIMEDPSLLPDEAKRSVNQPKTTDSGYSSAS